MIKQKHAIKNQKVFINKVPNEILNNDLLNQAIDYLPKNYEFEIHKQIWRIQTIKKELKKEKIKVVLQMPEGLLMFACLLYDIIVNFTNSDAYIMGEATYGACCINDIAVQSLECDLLIHFGYYNNINFKICYQGHSCLKPITECEKFALIFHIFLKHLCQIFLKNQIFTIQWELFNLINQFIKYNKNQRRQKYFINHLYQKQAGYMNIHLPQEKPRSAGEVLIINQPILGCTSPIIEQKSNAINSNFMIFISDGRFHIESAMISNPNFQFYQYSPYTKKLTLEKYDNNKMMSIRHQQIKKAQENILKFKKQKRIAILFGTLGRQGNIHILQTIIFLLKQHALKYSIFLISEINQQLINNLHNEIIFLVQIACPRLSIDWGHQFDYPLLTPFEMFVALDEQKWDFNHYPMDYYSDNGGPWSNNYYRKQQELQQQNNKNRNNIILEYQNN